jgi:hypothetical protein
MNESWSLISFGVVLDIIWCRRNEFIFNIDFIASNKLKDNVLAIVRDIRNSFEIMQSTINKRQGEGSAREGINWRARSRVILDSFKY